MKRKYLSFLLSVSVGLSTLLSSGFTTVAFAEEKGIVEAEKNLGG